MGKAPGLHPGPWLLFVLFVGGRFTVRLFHNGNLFSNCFFEIELPTILALAMLKTCRWVVLTRFSQLRITLHIGPYTVTIISFEWKCTRKCTRISKKPLASIGLTVFKRGLTPLSSTTYEKSELIPHRECVRIFHFYQGYFLLMFIPGGFFILRVFLLFAHSIPDRSPATMIAENH